MISEVSSLEHKLGDDSVEDCIFIAVALLTSAESSEILSSFGNNVVVEKEGDSSRRNIIDRDVKVALAHQVNCKILNRF